MEILAEAVKYFIGKKEILKGIDLHLSPKEFLGIIGPNGSGKSTFSSASIACRNRPRGRSSLTEKRWMSCRIGSRR